MKLRTRLSHPCATARLLFWGVAAIVLGISVSTGALPGVQPQTRVLHGVRALQLSLGHKLNRRLNLQRGTACHCTKTRKKEGGQPKRSVIQGKRAVDMRKAGNGQKRGVLQQLNDAQSNSDNGSLRHRDLKTADQAQRQKRTQKRKPGNSYGSLSSGNFRDSKNQHLEAIGQGLDEEELKVIREVPPELEQTQVKTTRKRESEVREAESVHHGQRSSTSSHGVLNGGEKDLLTQELQKKVIQMVSGYYGEHADTPQKSGYNIRQVLANSEDLMNYLHKALDRVHKGGFQRKRRQSKRTKHHRTRKSSKNHRLKQGLNSRQCQGVQMRRRRPSKLRKDREEELPASEDLQRLRYESVENSLSSKQSAGKPVSENRYLRNRQKVRKQRSRESLSSVHTNGVASLRQSMTGSERRERYGYLGQEDGTSPHLRGTTKRHGRRTVKGSPRILVDNGQPPREQRRRRRKRVKNGTRKAWRASHVPPKRRKKVEENRQDDDKVQENVQSHNRLSSWYKQEWAGAEEEQRRKTKSRKKKPTTTDTQQPGNITRSKTSDSGWPSGFTAFREWDRTTKKNVREQVVETTGDSDDSFQSFPSFDEGEGQLRRKDEKKRGKKQDKEVTSILDIVGGDESFSSYSSRVSCRSDGKKGPKGSKNADDNVKAVDKKRVGGPENRIAKVGRKNEVLDQKHWFPQSRKKVRLRNGHWYNESLLKAVLYTPTASEKKRDKKAWEKEKRRRAMAAKCPSMFQMAMFMLFLFLIWVLCTTEGLEGLLLNFLV